MMQLAPYTAQEIKYNVSIIIPSNLVILSTTY